jgi:hypothetical protein
MKVKELHDKVLVLVLSAYVVFMLPIVTTTYLTADEGTHLLLSIFYKDLFTHLLHTKDFSFENAYNFGLNYLIHYPKIQIAYPPLYHFTNAITFTLFGASEFVARVVTLIYAIVSFVLFYSLLKRIFNSRIAFFATLLFAFSPFSLFYASHALQDFTVWFFFLFSLYTFYLALEKNSTKYFALAGFLACLAALSKQMGGFVIFFLLVVGVIRKIGWKKIMLMLFCFAILLIPYLFLQWKIGGFEINKLVAIGYAFEQGEPTSILDPLFWLWYLIEPTKTFYLLPLLVASLFVYAWKKEEHWKTFLLFFAIFYVLLSIIPNKEPRFATFFLFPCFATLAYYITKFRKLIPLIISAYLIFSFLWFISTIQFYPQREIAEFVLQGKSIAIFSEGDPFFSSVLMWYVRLNDKNLTKHVFRACNFVNMTKEELINTLKEKNVDHIVFSTWAPVIDPNKISDKIELMKVFEKNGLKTEIYKFKEVKGESKVLCNKICLTGWEICREGEKVWVKK